MDALYTGDIPNDFKYAQFHDNYIDLFNKESSPTLDDEETYHVFRVFTNYHNFMYEQYDLSTTQNQTLTEIKISDNWYDRPDMLNILSLTCCYVVVTIFILNIFTSIFKKGGLFGGLL